MSHYYEMSVWVDCINQDRRDAIQEAAEAQWSFDSWDGIDELCGDGGGNLCGGETEEAFAERLARAIVRANGAPCEVQVIARYMENVPTETFSFGKDDYQRLTEEEKVP